MTPSSWLTELRSVVIPDLLQNPAVRKWLDGIEPAWTLLDPASFAALGRPPSPETGPIRLAADLTDDEIRQSPLARNTLALLEAAATGSGLKLTATGNLSRAVVAEMIDRFTWPEFDRVEFFDYHKVVNEPDFFPLFFIRQLPAAAKFLRPSRGHLKITALGRRMLEAPNRPALQAMLFQVAYWRLDLDRLGRALPDRWPQRDIGIVLWSLSVAATDWQPYQRLTRLCTLPIDNVLAHPWDIGSFAMEARILQPLHWFGLLDHQEVVVPGGHVERQQLYRKSVLFDRFLSFDVRLETRGIARH